MSLYGLEVQTLPAAQLASYYQQSYMYDPLKRDRIHSSSFDHSLCRALGISYSFFSKQEQDIQLRLIRDKQLVSDTLTFWYLEDRQNIPQYLSRVNPFFREDPHASFLSSGWALDRSDWDLGYMKYSYQTQSAELDQWTPALFLLIPVMYERPFSMLAGLRRLVCTNGLTTTKETGSLKITVSDQIETVLDALISGSYSLEYLQNLIFALEETEMDLEKALVLLQTMQEDKTLSINRTFLKKVASQLVALPEDDPTLPTSVTSTMDFVDTFTRLANQQTRDVKTQVKMENFAFNLAYQLVSQRPPETIMESSMVGVAFSH